jgi:hypothetical protein
MKGCESLMENTENKSPKLTANTFITGTILVSELLKNKQIKKFINGTYSDGTPRSVIDAICGEDQNPKCKKKHKNIKKKDKKKSKKKTKTKNKKHKKVKKLSKFKSKDLDWLS